MRRFAAALAVTTVILPIRATAQETRIEVLEGKRSEKATRLRPYEPSRLEKLVATAEEGKLRRLITPYNGFFAEFGYFNKPVGAGFGFGGGFRHDLFDRRGRIVLETGATFRRYWMTRADFSLPRLAARRLEVGIEAVYRNQPQEDFYGGGIHSNERDRVSFLLEGGEVQGRFVWRPADWLHAGSRFGYLTPSVGPGHDSRFPSIEQRYDNTSAPGLAAQPDFTYGELFAEVDTRDEPGNPRAGGHYMASWRHYSDRDMNRYSFTATELLLQHFIPIFDKKRVFAFQFGLIGTGADSGQQVPFYMQPTVGGSRQLRSVADFRFRDKQALWMNVEYRWEAFGALDMALFSDWGTVAARAADFNVSDVKGGYGLGFRFKTKSAVLMRIDITTGAGEGLRTWFRFSKAF
jgi:Omp85 superfamily domain